MIACIISFIAGGFAGALVMALCAASKNSNVNIDLEDTSENIVENKDVNMAGGEGGNSCMIRKEWGVKLLDALEQSVNDAETSDEKEIIKRLVRTLYDNLEWEEEE